MSLACWWKGYMAGNGFSNSDNNVKAVCEEQEKREADDKKIKENLKQFFKTELCINSGFDYERCTVSIKAAEQLLLLDRKGTAVSLNSAYLCSFDAREVAWRSLKDHINHCQNGEKCQPITDIAEKIKIYNIYLMEEGMKSKSSSALLWAGLYLQELSEIGIPEVVKDKFNTYQLP